ncbi:MAG: hypothetical protein EP338_08825 [Bacteroidetes bacterium]|nr:MAG: hypothetical protein EP338_08825 [Bacteroidota bacterium]
MIRPLLLLLAVASVYACKQKEKVVLQEEEIVAEEIKEKINFQSEDGLEITAYLYQFSPEAPTILLCHQAGFNKSEYQETALNLYEMGYNCLAIDQRSGGTWSDSTMNETFEKAVLAGKKTKYADADQDVVAGINYLFDKYQRPCLVLGSSYSADLVIYQGIKNPKVKAIIAFSPGNYIQQEKGDLRKVLDSLDKPLFVSSSKDEIASQELLLKRLKHSRKLVHHKPTVDGQHGSKALWSTHEGHQEYWKALKQFLNHVKKND